MDVTLTTSDGVKLTIPLNPSRKEFEHSKVLVRNVVKAALLSEVWKKYSIQGWGGHHDIIIPAEYEDLVVDYPFSITAKQPIDVKNAVTEQMYHVSQNIANHIAHKIKEFEKLNNR